MTAATRWEKAYASFKRALAAGDLGDAEQHLARMWHEAEEREDDALRANTHFQEGRLHDAAGRFELAEAAFAAALAIDSALGRGPRAIADVWHSLGIVRSNLGRREDARQPWLRSSGRSSPMSSHVPGSSLASSRVARS